MKPGLDIRIEDTPFDPYARPEDRFVAYRRDGETRLYRVFLRVVGPDTIRIKSVAYHLHETFTPSVVHVKRSSTNPEFMTNIWTWGKFEVKVVVEDIRERTHTLFHYLRYDEYFEPEKFAAEKLTTRAV